MMRRPTPARPSLPDGFAYANPFFAWAVVTATLLGYGARGSASMRLPYDNGPLPGPDWDRGVRQDEDGLRSHMAFMKRAYRGEFR